jgi:hypothetical protein
MTERGKARATVVSAGSNTRIAAGAGTLYRVLVSPVNGSTVRIEGSADLGAAPDLNGAGVATIASYGTFTTTNPATIDFGPGVGFSGLAIAATSNARLTVVYE